MNSPDASQASSIDWGSPGPRRLRGAPYLSRRPLPYRTQPTPDPEPKPRQEREIPPRNNDVQKPLFQPASASPANRIEDESGLDELFREEAPGYPVPPHDFEYEQDAWQSPQFGTRYREVSVVSTVGSSDIVMLPSKARSGHIPKIVESEEEEDELDSTESESEAETPPSVRIHQSSYRSARVNVEGIRRTNNRKLFDKAVGNNQDANDTIGDDSFESHEDIFFPNDKTTQKEKSRPLSRRTSLRNPPFQTASPDKVVPSPVPPRTYKQINDSRLARNEAQNALSRTSSTHVRRQGSIHRRASRPYIGQQKRNGYVYEAVYTRPQPGHELRGGRTTLEFGYVIPTPAPAELEQDSDMEDALGRISLKDCRAPIIGGIAQSAFAKSAKRKRVDSDVEMDEQAQIEAKHRKPLNELRTSRSAKQTSAKDTEANDAGKGDANKASVPDFADRLIQKNARNLSRSTKKKKGRELKRRKSESLKGNYPKLQLGLATDRKTKPDATSNRAPMTPRTSPRRHGPSAAAAIHAESPTGVLQAPPADLGHMAHCNNLPSPSEMPRTSKQKSVIPATTTSEAPAYPTRAKQATSQRSRSAVPAKRGVSKASLPAVPAQSIQPTQSARPANSVAPLTHTHPALSEPTATNAKSQGARKLSKLVSTQKHVEEHVPSSHRRASIAGKLLKPVAEAADPSKFKLPILVLATIIDNAAPSGVAVEAAVATHIVTTASVSAPTQQEQTTSHPVTMHATRNSKDSIYTLAGPSTAWTTSSGLRAREGTSATTSIATDQNGNNSVYTLAGPSTAWTATAVLAERNQHLNLPSGTSLANFPTVQRSSSVLNYPQTPRKQSEVTQMYSTPELPPPGQARSSHTASFGTTAFPTPSPPDDELYYAATAAYQYQTPKANSRAESYPTSNAGRAYGFYAEHRSHASPSASPDEVEIPLVPLQQKLEYGRKIVQVPQEAAAGADLPKPVFNRRRVIQREETEQEIVSDMHDWAMREAEQN